MLISADLTSLGIYYHIEALVIVFQVEVFIDVTIILGNNQLDALFNVFI